MAKKRRTKLPLAIKSNYGAKSQMLTAATRANKKLATKGIAKAKRI